MTKSILSSDSLSARYGALDGQYKIESFVATLKLEVLVTAAIVLSDR